jgi:ribulose-5-phosphate 4-epimerase/fuculose-1-phosphate aldolase
MPPSEAITEDAPIVDKTPSSPPSGPPSKPPSGPPSKPPNLPADESKSEVSEEILEENNQQNESIESSSDEDTQQEIVEDEGDDNIASVAKQSDNEETDVEKEEKDSVEAPEEVVDSTSNDLLNPPTINDDLEGEDIVAKEAEIARLSAEVERLRHSMSGAADIIEEMENPPMPPMIQEDVVIGAHIVADMARMARQLDRDQLIRASMGTIAMLHPERFDVLISTKHKSLLPRMNEKDICAGKLNSEPPRGAPTDWRVLEVLLASTNIVTGGPAAVIHCHGPYSTAVSCEKDLVLMQPIDEIGKEHIGKVIIVDPDDENPREYLRQVAEALKQGGMRCVVIRGNGAYAVGADLDQAWANAAMLEHSMKIVMLARQANLKI